MLQESQSALLDLYKERTKGSFTIMRGSDTTAEEYSASVESGVTTSCYDLLTPRFADYPQMGWFNSDTVKRCRIQEEKQLYRAINWTGNEQQKDNINVTS